MKTLTTPFPTIRDEDVAFLVSRVAAKLIKNQEVAELAQANSYHRFLAGFGCSEFQRVLDLALIETLQDFEEAMEQIKSPEGREKVRKAYLRAVLNTAVVGGAE